MLRFEQDQRGSDRIPRVRVSGEDQVAADLASEPIARTAPRFPFFVVRRQGRYRRAVEDEHVLRERRDHQVGVDLRELPRRRRGAGFHQHLEPDAEPAGVEPLIQAWFAGAPEVQIEHPRQLARRRQRHQLAAILESTVLDDAVEHFGLQSRHDVRELRRVQDSIEQRAPVRGWGPRAQGVRATAASTTNGFGHESAMIPAAAPDKQS